MRLLLSLLLVVFLAACAPSTPAPAGAPLAPSRLLNPGQPAQASADAQFQAQPWQFTGRAGQTARLRLSAGSAGITLALVAPSGATLARGNDIRVALPGDGAYTALVRFAPGETSAYALALDFEGTPSPAGPAIEPVSTDDAAAGVPSATARATAPPTMAPTPTPVFAPLGLAQGRLTSGMPVAGTLTRPDEHHVYTFRADAGRFVSIRMERLSGQIDPLATLYGPDGMPIAADDNTGGGGAAFIRSARLSVTGQYAVRASGDGLTGEYQLGITVFEAPEPVTPIVPEPTATPTLTPTPEPLTDRLADHVGVPGRIETPGQAVLYPLIARAGELLTIGASPIDVEGLHPRLTLYSPASEAVQMATAAGSNAGGDALIAAYTAPASGTYLVEVRGEPGETGDFVLAYGVGASRENVLQGALPPDVTADGLLSRRGLRDVWLLTLNRGDVISVSASPRSTDFNPALDVVGPDGTVLAADDNGGGGAAPRVERLAAPASGEYRIRVTGANAGSSGPYTLVWRYVSLAPSPTPPRGAVVLLSADAVAPERAYVDFPFQGQAGQTVRIRVVAAPGSALDPVVALLTLDGTTVARADDSGGELNPVLEVVLPNDGTFIARVDGYASSGAFEILIEALY